SWLPAPVATAPASMTPRSSNARRCSRPLPATGSGGEDAKSCVRFLRMLMVLSLDRRIISQKPNAIPALMRARRERPRHRRGAEERDELAASHVGHRGFPPLCANKAHLGYHGVHGRSLENT